MERKNLPRLVLVTTVPETLDSILKGQPGYLSRYFEVILITSPGNSISRIKGREKLPVISLKMERGVHPLKDLTSIWDMYHVLRKLRPDAIHSYTPKAGLVAMISAFLCKIPVRIHTFTGLIFPTSTGLKKGILIWADRLICSCSTHVIPEGLGVQRDLERYGITRKPLQIIGHGNIAGVDTSHFDPKIPSVRKDAEDLKKQLAIESEATVFCFIGRLNRDKGIGELYDAFLMLPENSHLLLAGSLDTSAPISIDLQEAIEKHPRIHSLGFMIDIRPVLRLANFLVLPSYREGFPNVVLQAGSMEVPVIATDINGCNEAIQPGVNGWLVPVKDSQALGSVMLEAIKMPHTLREKIGLRARAQIQQRFEQRNHWDRMVLFYKKLIKL